MASFPPCANSGQYCTTGASRSSLPREARIWAQSEVAPLVEDHTTLIVSSFQGPFVTGRAIPPHISTTVSPSKVTQTDAPTSPRCWKFCLNSSATRSNLASQNPLISPWLTVILTLGKFVMNLLLVRLPQCNGSGLTEQ